MLLHVSDDKKISYLLCCLHQTLLRGQSLSLGRYERNASGCVDQQLARQEDWFSLHPAGGKKSGGCFSRTFKLA